MSTQIARPATVLRAAPFLGFAGFGAFWGVWGASLPLLRTQADVSDAEFGIALLFVAAGALPAMLLTGRLIDALGLRVAGVLLALLGVMGLVVSVTSATYAALCVGILLAGARTRHRRQALPREKARDAAAGRAQRFVKPEETFRRARLSTGTAFLVRRSRHSPLTRWCPGLRRPGGDRRRLRWLALMMADRSRTVS